MHIKDQGKIVSRYMNMCLEFKSAHHCALCAGHHNGEEGFVNIQTHSQGLYIGTCSPQ